jgi:hypothetical protein
MATAWRPRGDLSLGGERENDAAVFKFLNITRSNVVFSQHSRAVP